MSATLAEYKVEEALQQLLQAQAGIAALIADDDGESPFNVYTGFDESGIDYSCIHVAATSSEPLIGQGPMTGNWVVNVSIRVFTSIKDTGITKSDHYTRISYAQAVIMADSLQSDMNGITADLVVGEPMMRGRTTAVANDCWIHETQLAIPCRDGS